MELKPGYKQTEVGVIPEDWKVIPFQKLLDFRNGINADRHAYGKGVAFINVFEIISKGHLKANDIPGRVSIDKKSIESYLVRRGDIVFNRSSETQNEVGLSSVYLDSTPAVFGGFVIRGQCKQALDPVYSGYAFRAPTIRTQIVARGQGAIRANIGQSDLKQICTPLPPLDEQRAIASALSDADALIESLDQLIAKKRQIKQGAMQELLTGKRRLPGFGGEWEVKTFGELFTFSGGHSASRDQLSTEGFCYLHYGDIHGATKTTVDTNADYQNIPKLKIPLKQVSPTSLLKDGDVVFVDASEDDEGTSRHVVIVNKESVPFISGLHTIVAKSKSDELVKEYREYCFQTTAIRQQFLFYAVGTKVSGISKANISKLTLPIPSVSEQTAIAAILSDMDAEITALESRLAKARQIKQGMMQELLTGRIRLL